MSTRRRNDADDIDQRMRDVLERCRYMLVQMGTAEPVEAVPPIDVDGRVTTGTAAVTYTAGGLSITIDFEILTRTMLGVADNVFAEIFVVKFKGDGTMADAINHKIAESLRIIDGAALATLSDYFTELVFQGVGYAAETFGREVLGSSMTQSGMKALRSISRSVAEDLLATRIPNVGPGGKTQAPPRDEVLIAFHRAAARLYPFWKDVRQRQLRGDDTWHQDAKLLPEYRRFKPTERKHADAVLALLQRGRMINGARPDAKVLTREHARLITGGPNLSDSQLREYERRGRRLASPKPRD